MTHRKEQFLFSGSGAQNERHEQRREVYVKRDAFKLTWPDITDAVNQTLTEMWRSRIYNRIASSFWYLVVSNNSRFSSRLPSLFAFILLLLTTLPFVKANFYRPMNNRCSKIERRSCRHNSARKRFSGMMKDIIASSISQEISPRKTEDV